MSRRPPRVAVDTPRALFSALVVSAMMRGVLHVAHHAPRRRAAAIRSGEHVGLVTLTMDDRVVWLPAALSRPHVAIRRFDLTELPLPDALSLVFRSPLAV
jgi:hypothetical protein